MPLTERGEALESPDNWYAIWTRSHSERLVFDQLSALGFSTFLPELGMWSKRQGQMHVVSTPMFPGYLFVRDRMDKHAYIEMLKVRGLVRILENGWTRLTPIPDEEVTSIERVMQSGVPVFPHALHDGDRVARFPVRALDEAPGLGRAAMRDATLALAARAGVADRPAGAAPTHPGPRWPWLLAWLAVAAGLWWLERSRAGAERRTASDADHADQRG